LDLRGKRVIVTGGAGCLGRAIVEGFLARGALVAVLDLDGQALARLREERTTVECIECDLTDADKVERALDALAGRWTDWDVLVNGAGLLHSGALLGLGKEGVTKHSTRDWDRVIAANLSAAFYVTVNVAAHMVRRRTQGVIVNITSVSAGGNAGQSAYSAAKAGLTALTAVWAKELNPLGIRVFAVAPGFIDTSSTRAALNEAALAATIKKIPLRRLGTVQELVQGLFAAVENDYFNGKTLELDGGVLV
jgi:3-oxoacyl-[acyl-carrier protein] reductase